MTDVFDRLKAALCDRYAIEREIGSGGMATVYLAEDLKHKRKVAVKVLRPELAAALGPERFLKEIEIAAGLTHPHILPLHDSGESDGFLFYVMPYIEGESLRDKLAREGELPIPDAVKILREVVDALAHAHDNNVVHRDIKPDNVMLSGRHALVTDFGVAKAVTEATGRQELTTAGVALGTPAYMAPEQAAADPHIDHRADIYAVGALAYELLTGRPPFTGTTQQEILAAHVTKAAEPVTKYRDSVPAALEQLVLKCLEKKAADRWQTAEELLPQLEALATPSGGVTPTGMVPVKGARSWKKSLYALVGVVAAVAIGFGAFTMIGGGGDSLNLERVAVAPFVNRTGDPEFDTYGRWTATTITQGLQRAGIGEVVPSSIVDRFLQEVGDLTGDAVSQMAELTGAGIVVTGVLYLAGDSLELSGEVVDAIAGDVLYALETVTGPEDGSREMLTEMARRVAGALASHFGFGMEFGFDPTTFNPPANPEAFREYAQGLDMFLHNQQASLPHFHRAHELDSNYAAPLVYVGTVHLNAHRYAVADSFFSIARLMLDRMTPVERAQLDYLTAQLQEDAELAYRMSLGVKETEPYASGPYLACLSAYHTNRLYEALEHCNDIDMSLPGNRQWGGSWGVPTAAHHMLGDYEAEYDFVREGLAEQPDRRSFRNIEVRALIGLGRIDEALDRIDALSNLRSPGHLGYYLRQAAAEFRAHGHLDAAERMFERTIDWYRGIPPEELDRWRRSFAIALRDAGRWEEAAVEYRTLVERAPDDPNLLGPLGVIAAARGDLERAAEINGQLAGMDRPYLFGRNTLWRARIAAMLGERDEAVRLLRQAFSEREWYGIWLHRDIYLESLHGYEPYEQLLRSRE